MKLPIWATGLLVTTGIQMAGSFMSQSLPVVAPLLTTATGVGREQAGTMYALYMAGSILFLAAGTPLIARFGPLRTMRIGLVCGTGALALVAIGIWPVVIGASLLLGLAYGPCPPGTTRVLAATAPPRHRALIFSIKQSGAQVGGVFAGLFIAPVAAHYGWEAGLLLPIGLGVATAIAVGPAGQALSVARDPPKPLSWSAMFGVPALRAPFAAVAASPGLMGMTLVTTSLAVAQACLFSFCVTWLVTVQHMSLPRAGMVYACMQAGGTLGRIAVGWTADRSQNVPRDLGLQCWVSAALVAGWAFLPIGAGLGIVIPLAFAIGVAAASWPGLILSETSRLAPPGRIADAAAGSSMITFLGYVFGPLLFSLGVRQCESWVAPYLAVAGLVAATAAAVSWRLARQGR